MVCVEEGIDVCGNKDFYLLLTTGMFNVEILVVVFGSDIDK